mgnify:CR=1 FL=1
MQTIINILVFFVILGAIVLIHELGHFLTAKLFGVYCAEFSIGMGPKLFSKKKEKQIIKFVHFLLVVMLQWQVKLIKKTAN